MPVVKRRRVTAEMEGKYIINMPKGTTARTRRILAQQDTKGRPYPVAWSSPSTHPNHSLPTCLLLTHPLPACNPNTATIQCLESWFKHKLQQGLGSVFLFLLWGEASLTKRFRHLPCF